MSLDLLSCMKSFVAVAEQQSFAKAATGMWKSNAVITKQIQRLEETLGKKLFERTTRRLHLTEAGTLYLCHVRKILAQLAQANEALANMEEEPHGIINLGISLGFNSMFFNSQFQLFLKKYPKISLHIASESYPSMILEGYADIVISTVNLDNPQLIKEKLLTIKRSVFGSPAYLERYGIPKSLADLKHHNCLISARVSPDSRWEFVDNQKIPVKGNYVSESGADLIRAAINGIGLLWMPDVLVQSEVTAGLLKLIDLGIGPTCTGMYIYYMPVAGDNPIKLLVDFLIKQTKIGMAKPSQTSAANLK